jgi:peptide/nickel transport system permease protein
MRGRPAIAEAPDMSANPIDRSFLKMALGHPAFVLGFVLSAMFRACAGLLRLDAVRPDPARHRRKLRTPSLEHWFGTDHFGRDMFSMIMVGARTSIAVAFVAVGIGMALGVPLGLYAAARGAACSTRSSCAATIWSLPSRRCCWRS